MIRYLEVKTRNRQEFVDITGQVTELIRNSGVYNGVCHLFVMHTTAAVTINEGADPAVQHDILAFLQKAIPNSPHYTHSEGNSDAHIKSSLMGASLAILVDGGKPVLGTWQAVYFCEFDGPRHRKVALRIVEG
jgi:secondary thiamine-phosphate synthase enzyme